MPTLTDDFTAVALYIQNLLKAGPDAAGLALADVFYGDQPQIPKTPTACVETGFMTRDLSGTSFQTDNNIRIYVMVYVDKIQGVEVNRLAADQLAVAIMHALHHDTQMGGNVVQGWVTRIEPGFARRGGALMSAARITWEGLSKTRVGTP